MMSGDKVCHLFCNSCKAQTVGSSLKQCLSDIKCLSDGGVLDDTCKISLVADGKAVFKIDQVIKNDYKGETVIGGEAKEPEPKKGKRKKEPKNENQEKILPNDEEQDPLPENPNSSESQ